MKKSTARWFLFVFMMAALQPALLNGQSPSQTDVYTPLSVGQKGVVFGYRIIAPSSLAKSAFTAGINQLQDSPHEWGQGLAGYSRRYGSKLGTRAAENGIGFVIAAAFHQDPRYFRSADSRFWHRVGHALDSTVITRVDSGGRSINLWRLSANYGAQFVSNTWRPERYTNTSTTLARGTASIGYDAASNLLKEFWPDIRRLIRRH